MKTKLKHPASLNTTCKTACRLSAAALMLGVSHAATIGINFTTTYCTSSSYSGAYVTATAFGVTTNNWESLTQMLTGYGCTGGVGPFTLNETIDTTTATLGLNPLPNGSLSVTWSAYEANVSGFGGYQESPPSYTFGGSGHKPGGEEVYWGFLRDGVNFGNGQTGGNNNQQGWSVDITGLKSVFTNSPFVVEMIGAGDSIQNLTNVFVIDATLLTTQSVIYPNIPPISNVGDTAWPRGIGGGLSTSSGAVNTDHLQLIGNRAQHSAAVGTNAAFNNASEVAGFILTDQPVVTMSPQSVLASPGDTVTLRSIAIGVPPLAMHWSKNGVALPGATNLSYVISNVVAGAGSYQLTVTNNYGSATSAVAVVAYDHLAIASGPSYTPDSSGSAPPHDAEVFGATVLASSTDPRGTNRLGVASFVATNNAQIVVPLTGVTDLDSTNGAVTFWMLASGVPTGSGEMLFDRRTSSGMLVYLTSGGTIGLRVANGVNFGSVAVVTDTNWHHVAVVNDDTNGVYLYIDGVLDTFQPGADSWTWPAGQEIELGLSHDSFWQAYDGKLDDVRFYNRILATNEVTSIYQTGAVVDSTALKLRLDFNSVALTHGVTVSWQSSSDTLQSARSVTGPWTNVPASSPVKVEALVGPTFYRYVHTATNILSNPFDM